MIWFFQRAGEEMRVVTRFDRDSQEYVVEIEWSDRPAESERYADYDAFNKRVQGLHVQLLQNRWQQAGTPSVFADGWRGPTSRN